MEATPSLQIRIKVFLAAACLFAPLPAKASSGTEGASFLEIPVGAAPASMGSAYTALATNAYAMTSNPAGLAFLKETELAAQHLSYLQSIQYEHAGLAIPLPQGQDSTVHRGLGLSVQDLNSGDITRTDVLNGAPVTGLGSFSSQWGSYNLSYGQTVTEKLGLGLTGKVIHASIDDVSANAYAFDAGGLYRWNERVDLAASVLNVGTPLKFLSEGDSLPMEFHAGAAYRPTRQWVVSTEGVYAKTGLASLHLGSQWQPMDPLSLRVGYKTDTVKGLNALAGFTAGIGLQVWGQELAYAWVPYGELGNSQYLSLVMRFGAPRDGRRNLIRYTNPKEPHVAETPDADDQRFAQLIQDPGVER